MENRSPQEIADEREEAMLKWRTSHIFRGALAAYFIIGTNKIFQRMVLVPLQGESPSHGGHYEAAALGPTRALEVHFQDDFGSEEGGIQGCWVVDDGSTPALQGPVPKAHLALLPRLLRTESFPHGHEDLYVPRGQSAEGYSCLSSVPQGPH